MKTGYTDITLVLDRSGSMDAVKDDTIGGVNKFLDDQQKLPGEATFSLVQFDEHYDVVYEGKNIKQADKLTKVTFIPRGMTALLDAIGKTIERTGKRLSEMKDEDKPEKVIFVIQTDGYENFSKQYTIEKIAEMITHQRDVYKWEFLFLGANQDAIATAASMNIPISASITYAQNPRGVHAVYSSVSKSVSDSRSGGVAVAACFTDTDRKAQEDAGV